ncbi:MAG: sigma 54-interacting transcriptional regulator [Sandaracinaceae bacterium]|nr:sigma 54-interacting transcriptional regulator [Sandaracinaceae bacterium]
MSSDFDDFEGVETFRLPSPREEKQPPRWLVVLGATPSVVALVPGSALTVGRSTECEIAIADRAISRRHAVIHVGDQVTVEDLGSANGLVVAGVPVQAHGHAVVPVGSAIQIGTALLVVHAGPNPPTLDAEAAATPRPRPPGHLVVDPAVERLYDLVARVAPTRLNVLLLGETGVGKEVFAAAVHAQSTRSGGPFVKINCAALSPQLLESELFGHERGAFTGADRAHAGLVEAAHGGTLLLDEVGEMPLALQAKLLRVIEALEVKRVGAVQPRSVDVRFVAATNRDLEAESALGTFRQDLYYRLKGISLEIPALRDRPSEILPLAAHFLAASGRPHLEPTEEAAAALLTYAWPGNVRELRNVMERAAALAEGPKLGVDHLPQEVVDGRRAPAPSPAVASSGDLREDLAALERQRIVAALAECEGNQTKAARLLGMPRRTLISRIEEYGLPRPRKDRGPR